MASRTRSASRFAESSPSQRTLALSASSTGTMTRRTASGCGKPVTRPITRPCSCDRAAAAALLTFAFPSRAWPSASRTRRATLSRQGSPPPSSDTWVMETFTLSFWPGRPARTPPTWKSSGVSTTDSCSVLWICRARARASTGLGTVSESGSRLNTARKRWRSCVASRLRWIPMTGSTPAKRFEACKGGHRCFHRASHVAQKSAGAPSWHVIRPTCLFSAHFRGWLAAQNKV
mmetsp:Transcript_12327/g.31396  ORF Transcript_12327/g.31396 Transcript_12327/m.31396 type:complete len:232 (+) Transcript_12327:849-1544(+)